MAASAERGNAAFEAVMADLWGVASAPSTESAVSRDWSGAVVPAWPALTVPIWCTRGHSERRRCRRPTGAQPKRLAQEEDTLTVVAVVQVVLEKENFLQTLILLVH